jgi:GGDEF domain-containing protein
MTNSSRKVTRLPMLAGLPVRQNFVDLLTAAFKQAGSTVQLPWINDAKQESMTLGCTVLENGAEPEWILTSGLGMHSQVVWSFNTSDAALIENMMFDGSERVEQSNSSTSLSNLKSIVDQAANETEQRAFSEYESMQVGKNKSKGVSTLHGNLTEMQVTGLLQSVSINKMTGELVIQDGDFRINMFFEDGVPVHAVSPQSVGELAIMDLLTWEVGDFKFTPLERTPEKTVHRRLEGILMEGVSLVDKHKYLEKHGLKLSSFLFRRNFNLSEQEFEFALKDAAAVEMNSQKSFYQMVDDRNTFADILRLRPLVKAEWVPIVYNLVSSNLIAISEKPSKEAKQFALQQIGVEESSVRSAYAAIMRAESGMLNMQLLFHFLEQELIRAEFCRTPFSLIIFDVRRRDDKGTEHPIAGNSAKIISEAFAQIKRPIDILGHFRSIEYGLILPFTDANGATVFANRFIEVLKQKPLPQADSIANTVCSFGIASIPQDYQDLNNLIGAAVEAKNSATKAKMPIVKYNTLHR